MPDNELNPFIRLFTQRALKKAAKIVTVSEYVTQSAIKLGAHPDRVTVNYLGIDTRNSSHQVFVRSYETPSIFLLNQQS